MSKPIASTRIGIIGCGDILPNYLKGLQQFSELHLVGISDACDDIALARGQEFNVPAMSVQTLLESDASIIINLTPPAAHFAVCQQIIAANKHVYTEKPLATSFDQGQKLLAQADAKQLRIACAPDTFLGAAGQTARELIDQGILGRVVAGTATMMERGPDDWHPNPDFFYEHGAGPLMDMGVYYLTQLVQLLGPIASVKGMAHTSWSTRVVPRGTRQGKEITVNTPTHIVAGLQFCDGAFITLTTSFDVWKHQSQHIELFGELGTMVLPDPNNFGGKIFICHQDGDWHEAHTEKPFAINVRGLGVADLASAIHNKRTHCASAEMALHVLEVMEKVLLACEDGKAQNIATRCARPELLQMQA